MDLGCFVPVILGSGTPVSVPKMINDLKSARN